MFVKILQVRILLSILFVCATIFASAQNSSEITVHNKNGKVYVEIFILLDNVNLIVNDETYCEAGTSTSFCFRNYINEKLKVEVNGSETLDFIIEASMANTKNMQINLSAESAGNSVSSYKITNNAFINEIPTFINNVNIKLNGNESNHIMDANNTIIEVN